MTWNMRQAGFKWVITTNKRTVLLNTFIQQGGIALIKRDIKDIYNVKNDYLIKQLYFWAAQLLLTTSVARKV